MNLLLASLVFISEIAWAGSAASTADEWFEIHNPSDQAVELSGWRVEGASTNPIVFAAGTAVAPGRTFLVSNYPADEPRTTLAAPPDLVTTAVALSNSALHLRLFDAQGTLIDEAGADGAAPLAGASAAQKVSMERVWPAAAGTSAEAWISASQAIGFDAGATELGTPGFFEAPAPVEEAPEEPPSPPAPSSPEEGVNEAPVTEAAPTESSTSTPETVTESAATSATATPQTSTREHAEQPNSAVRISEIYASPKSGGEEWVELVNRSNQGEFLDGFSLKDSAGGTTKLQGLLGPWSRLVIANPKGSLNNDGDTVSLFDQAGREIDRVVYGKLKADESFARVELQDAFAVTVALTRGEANVITARGVPVPPSETSSESQSPPAPSPSFDGAGSAEEGVSPVVIPAKAGIQNASQTGSSAATSPKAGTVTPKEKKPTEKKPAATAKPKPAPKSRFKGTSFEAIVAIPPGVYAKTRFQAFVDGALREIRLTKSMPTPPESGARISFIAQEKIDGEIGYLQVNPNSMTVAEEVDEPMFEAQAAWPETSASAELDGEVVSVETRRLRISVAGREGVIELPPQLSKPPFKTGDTIRVRGFVAAASATPTVWIPDATSLVLVKGYQAEAKAATPEKMPFGMMALLTIAAAGLGFLAYLRRERMRREFMQRKTPL